MYENEYEMDRREELDHVGALGVNNFQRAQFPGSFLNFVGYLYIYVNDHSHTSPSLIISSHAPCYHHVALAIDTYNAHMRTILGLWPFWHGL